MEPFSTSAIFAGINTAFKFAEFAVRIAEVGTENEVFVRMIQVVREDLNETERLLNVASVRSKLTSTPGKLPWIKAAINSTKASLNDIGKWVERARVDQQTTGAVRFETRVRWVFNDHEKLLNRKMELSTCHQQLSNVLSYLIQLEDVSSNLEPPTYHDTTFFDDFIAPRQKRKSTTKGVDAVAKQDEKTADLLRDASPSENPQIMTNLGIIPNVPQIPTANTTESATRANNLFVSNTYTAVASSAFPISPSISSETLSTSESPPPTYTTAMQPSRFGTPLKQNGPEYSHSYDRKYSYDSASHTSPSSSSTVPRTFQALNSKSSEIWAFRSSTENPELQGDIPRISGTNSLGPVNPFELLADPVIPKPPTDEAAPVAHYPRKDDPNKLAEMLGDVLFPVELPNNDPGPPPGYPPREYRRTVSELPTIIPKRRPVPSSSVSDPLVFVPELPSAQTTHKTSTDNLPREFRQNIPASRPTTGTLASEQIWSELPSSLAAQPSHVSPYLTPRPLSSISALSSPSASSISLAPSPFLSRLTGTSGPSGPDQRAVSPLVEPATPATQKASPIAPKRPETAASVRMRSQKTFMNMLGSIEQT